jgi:hypothetical protein
MNPGVAMAFHRRLLPFPSSAGQPTPMARMVDNLTRSRGQIFMNLPIDIKLIRNIVLFMLIIVTIPVLSSALFHDSAFADPEPASPNTKLVLELNTLEGTDQGCRLTFVVKNEFDTALNQLRFELALFDSNSRVSSVIVLDAGALPKNKTRVKRFNLPDLSCSDISRVLLNDITECKGEALTAAKCLSQAEISSRSDVDFSF